MRRTVWLLLALWAAPGQAELVEGLGGPLGFGQIEGAGLRLGIDQIGPAFPEGLPFYGRSTTAWDQALTYREIVDSQLRADEEAA